MKQLKAAIGFILVCAFVFGTGACAKKDSKTTVTANQITLATQQSQEQESAKKQTQGTEMPEEQADPAQLPEEQTPLMQGSAEGEKAPDFIATLAGGGSFQLSAHKNEVILLNFWATWCSPCVGELPDLEKLSQENMSGVTILAVNCGEQQSVVDDFVSENGYSLPVAYDGERSIEYLYPTQGIPYTLIIKDGVVQKTFIGAPMNPYRTYKTAIEECL